MGRKLHYQPNSFYRIDDRSGFAQRAGRTRSEWNGYIVDENLWEARQPQDLVRGVKDDQTVPNARPLTPAQYVGPVYTALSAPVGPRDWVLFVQSTDYMQAYEQIGVIQQDDSILVAVLLGFSADGAIVLDRHVPLGAPSGHSVIDYRIAATPRFIALTAEDGSVILTEDGQPIEI